MSNKVKVLYGIESTGGGSLKHLVYLATKLNKKIFEVTVIYSDARNEDIQVQLEEMENNGVKLIHYSMATKIHFFKDLKSLCYLTRFMNNSKYDIVHAHSSKAGFLFRIAAFLSGVKKIFYTPHCFLFQKKGGYFKSIFKLYERIMAHITTKIIVSQSEYKAATINKLANKPKFEIINNAIYFEKHKADIKYKEVLAKYNIREGNFIVGAIGRLTAQKDWKTYIYAAHEVLKVCPNTIFLIVGSGEQEKEIYTLIFELGLESKIILTGFVTDIHNIYSIMDVFVSTSLWEGLPYVFLEAMQYKKAIIATNSTYQDEIINNENAFLCPIKDYKFIADKIINLIKNKHKAISMGKKGNALLKRKYSFNVFVDSHTNLYCNSIF